VKAEKIQAPVLPQRALDAHKGTSGRLLCVAGAVGTSGAARLAARGALVGGVGLLTVAVPEPIRAEVSAEDPAFMTAGLRSTAAGTLAYPAARDILARSAHAHAVAIGPGLSTHEETVACVVAVLSRLSLPAVVDADALNAVAGSDLPPSSAARVWTPHAAEAARLLGVDPATVSRNREASARSLWSRLGGVVVLKGAGTLVTDGNELRVNPTGNPGLATGGSGDVLTGMVGAFLAAGLSALEAASAAVYIHGHAADELRRSAGERGLSMRALLDVLPGIVASHESAA
jgi:NAD(P)H-hydrate epimerase